MTQEHESETTQDRESETGGKIPWIIAVLVVAACFLPWRSLFSGSPAVHEMRVGGAVTRVPRPKDSRIKPEESGDTEATFIIGDADKAEYIGYFLSCADAGACTAEEFSDMLAEAGKAYSRLGGMLRTEYVKQTILQADLPLKRVDARQYEENGALVMTVKGDMDYYGLPRSMNGAQLLFLFRDRPYLMTVVAVSSAGSHRNALGEAWKWHGGIVAANP